MKIEIEIPAHLLHLLTVGRALERLIYTPEMVDGDDLEATLDFARQLIAAIQTESMGLNDNATAQAQALLKQIEDY